MNIVGTAVAWLPALVSAGGVYSNFFPEHKEEKKSSSLPAFIAKRIPWHKAGTSSSDVPARKEYPEMYRQVRNLQQDIFISSGNEKLTTPSFTKNVFSDSCGSNVRSPAFIIADKEIGEIDPQLNRIFIKHEFAHIYNNDHLTTPVLMTLSSAVTAVAVHLILPSIPSWGAPIAYLLPTVVAVVTAGFLTENQEIRAEEFAVENATDEELLHKKLFLDMVISTNRSLHYQFPDSFDFDGLRPSLYPSGVSIKQQVKLVSDEINKRGLGEKRVRHATEIKDRLQQRYLSVIEEKLKITIDRTQTRNSLL